MSSGNALIVYDGSMWPLRSTVKDHLYAFRRSSRHRVHYLNIAYRDVPADIAARDFDLVVFHTSFLSTRWAPEYFARLRERAQPLKGVGRHRVALPQDEFIHTGALSDFITEFDVDVVCSVAEASEWPKIYATVDRSKVRFATILTGYLDEKTVRRIDGIVADAKRTTDIGYRAWHAAAWLGSHGRFKTEVAARFQAAAPRHGLTTDISTREEDTLLGDDWFRHLARCRWTIGCEGGASILDTDGSVKARTEAYVAEHPDATFEEIRAACFADRDGELSLFALSPRHLEACATRTCQALIEGTFSGALVAGRHYVAIKPDWSNLDEVCEQMRDERLREEITERAYREVVASGRWTYAGMVHQIETAVLGAPRAVRPPSRTEDLALLRNRIADTLTWPRVAYRVRYQGRTLAKGGELLLRAPQPVQRVLRPVADLILKILRLS